MSTRTERMNDKAGNDRNAKILKELMARPDNRKCADCRKKDPRWASWNLGIFFCIRCSGHHRNMGTHISKVKSADLDTWTEEQIANMVRWGNGKANQYWEQQLPPDFTPPESSIDQFIRAKYERKQYAMKGPVPDPSTLKAVEGVAPTTTAVQTTRTSPPMARLAKPGPVANQPSFANFAPPPGAAAPKPSVSAAQQQPQEQQQQQQAPQSAAQQLFDVFSGPSSGSAPATSTNASPAKDVKNSILSLYGQQQPTPTSNTSPQMNGLGALGGLPQFGGGFGQPAQLQQQQPQQQQQQGGGFPASFGAFGQPSAGSPQPFGGASSFAGFGAQPQPQQPRQPQPFSQFQQPASPALSQQQQQQQPNQFQDLFTTPNQQPQPQQQPFQNMFVQQPLQPQQQQQKLQSSGIADFVGFGTATGSAVSPTKAGAAAANPVGALGGLGDDWGAFH
ncbi:uncharacterized protein EV422DRAFT_548294 [Fimicolochytrium jonesii]|uniref:uncharacterized protein n=1 Tax=Fimicolochytrium jonesii TaxID=1396493 RepID=UPI0022FF1B0E|nr:uncharacterized protein EV422DRAFT_548294 [Fimicolochytrium jonesii]KAI8815761.1 hypothetical protein EV422DRAFT_548294 [Fimicolochytrium jonesii]